MALGKYNVTFVTEQDLESGTDFDGIPSGQIGIYNVDSGSYLHAAESFLRTDFVSAASIADTTSSGAVTQALAPAIVPSRFQIVQGRDIGNPWCTPIIHAEDVQEISFRATTAGVNAKGVFDLTDGAADATIAVGEEYSVKMVIRSMAIDYEAFVNPSGRDGLFIGQVFNFHRTATSATEDTEAAAFVAEFNTVENFDGLFTASVSGGEITITADQLGVEFDLIVDASGVTTAGNMASVTQTACVRGTGDGQFILGAEKKSQGYWGYHNRIYLPQSPKLYADSSANYDMITINWNMHARAHSQVDMFTGENVVNIAVKDGSTNTNFDAAFGFNLDGSAGETVIYGKYNA